MVAISETYSDRKRFTTRQFATFAAVAAVAVWVGLTALREPSLPDFEATGEPIELPASFVAVSMPEFEGILVGLQGKPVIVNIWASWCAPCRTEMPLLQAAADAFDSEVVILGVATNDDPGSAQKFLDDFGLDYPNIFDTSGQIRVALGLTAYPTTYVFDAEGDLISRINGGISEQRIASIIEDVLR